MAVDERARRHLYERLDQILGGEAADTLMEELAFVGREQLARRHDIELLRRDMDAGFAQARAERQAVRAELHGEFEALRGEFQGLRGEFEALRGEFEGLRGEFEGLRGETATAIAELRADMATRFDQQTRQIVFAMIGALFTVAALAVGSGLLG